MHPLEHITFLSVHTPHDMQWLCQRLLLWSRFQFSKTEKIILQSSFAHSKHDNITMRNILREILQTLE